MAAVRDAEDLRLANLQFRGDAVALAGAHRDGAPARGSDAPVGEQVPQRTDRAGPHVDDHRRSEHPGQERHARETSSDEQLTNSDRQSPAPGAPRPPRPIAAAAPPPRGPGSPWYPSSK